MHILLKELLNIEEIASIIELLHLHNPESVISSPGIRCSGLSLAGSYKDCPESLLLFGEDEYSYIQSMEAGRARDVIKQFISRQDCAGIIFAKDCIPGTISSISSPEANLLASKRGWEATMTIISEALEELLAPVMTRHGVFMDIYGVGVLLTGESGIGKSELALDLISRGHRLVADDVVEIKKVRFDKIKGQSPPVLKGYIQIKGLGIINVEKLFGIVSTRGIKRIEMVIKLIEDDDFSSVQHLGTEESFTEYFDVSLPLKTIPVARGRDMAKIIEVATRDYMMKRKGIHQSADFQNQRKDILQEIQKDIKG